jgi:hypothetical protein
MPSVSTNADAPEEPPTFAPRSRAQDASIAGYCFRAKLHNPAGEPPRPDHQPYGRPERSASHRRAGDTGRAPFGIGKDVPPGRVIGVTEANNSRCQRNDRTDPPGLICGGISTLPSCQRRSIPLQRGGSDAGWVRRSGQAAAEPRRLVVEGAALAVSSARPRIRVREVGGGDRGKLGLARPSLQIRRAS